MKAKKFSCLKKMAIALLSAFGSTYLCEQIFSHTEDHSEACVQLKYSNINPNTTELSKDKDNIKKATLDCILPYPIKLIKQFFRLSVSYSN